MRKISIFLLCLTMATSCSKNEYDDNYSGNSSSSSSPSSSCICGAKTKDGTPCQRKVADCTMCWQHK
ncbi:MAG: hypothetical protein WC716_06740 [Chitinophagaceae bacterium]